jgi:hypothetical protein
MIEKLFNHSYRAGTSAIRNLSGTARAATENEISLARAMRKARRRKFNITSKAYAPHVEWLLG